MKKIVLSMIVAAAALVGCQKSEEFSVGKTISLSAELSQPEAGRTALVENEGVYSAIWKSGDKLTLFELADNAYTLYESNALTADAATASFTFDGVAAKEAASFRYVAGTNITSSTTVNNLRVELPSAQAPATMSTFDGAADILLSRPIDRESQPVSEALTFSTARVSAVVKLMIKNLALADGEKVEKVVFSCEQPIAGLFQVGVDDLEEGTYPVPFKWREEAYSVSITLPEAQSGDFATYFSCLPATLKAGEGYTVTLKTNQGGYHKVATVSSPLEFTAGDITNVTVNMSDAGKATTSAVSAFDPAEEYAFAFKAQDGTIYLMENKECNRRPGAATIASLGLTVNANNEIIGNVPAEYRWKASTREDENGTIWGTFFSVREGVAYYFINTYYAQGLAVSKAINVNSDTADGSADGWLGLDGRGPYSNEIQIATEGDGYRLYVSQENKDDLNVCVYGSTQFRALPASANPNEMGVVYFYRVNAVSQKSVYPVITKAKDITPGTYAILYNGGSDYVALPNATTISGSEGAYTNTLPAAVSIKDVAMTLDEKTGMVTSASVADAYKWVLTPNDKGKWIIRSAVNMNHYLYMRDNGGKGVAIGVPTEVTSQNSAFTNDWAFLDDAVKGMQGQVSGCPRYLYSNGTQFLAGNGMGTGLILVKLSDSTKQINE